jgi:hypothetical protein
MYSYKQRRNTPMFIHLCPRCLGTGRFDRGACFECQKFGALGFVRRARKGKKFAQVTAIRDEKEGRIDWVQIFGASNKDAVAITQRVQRVKGFPKRIIDSVEAHQIGG